MGVATAGRIAERLIEHGLDAATPVAIVENGTRASQRTVLGRLGALGQLVAESGIAGPAIIIIGAVARLADAIDSNRGVEAGAAEPARIAAAG
jgi:siroheme synthase